MNCAARLSAPIVAALVIGGFAPTDVSAQDSTPVVGARDFRTAPVLADGTYTDVILSGEKLWYAVPITNGEERFYAEVALAGADPSDDLTLSVDLIGPTLESFRRSAGPAVLEILRPRYGNKAAETWLWYLRVQLDSNGRRGKQAPIEIHVEGAAAGDTMGCQGDRECDLDETVGDLRGEIQELRAQLDAAAGAPTSAVNSDLNEEIAALSLERDELRAQLARDADDEPQPGPSRIPAAVGLLAAAALLGATVASARRIRSRRATALDLQAGSKEAAESEGAS